MKILYTIKSLLILFIIGFSSSLFAQQIPFQGKLIDLGVPVTGTRTFDFEITALGWTETHSGVQVTDGLYSLVLGSINPLPDTIFFGTNQRTLNITVNSQPLDPVQLYAAVAKTSLSQTADVTDKDFSGFYSKVSGSGTGVTWHFGLRGESDAIGSQFSGGVLGVSRRNPTGDAFMTGVYGRVEPNPSGSDNSGFSYGVRGEIASGDHGPAAVAVRGLSFNTNPNGINQSAFTNSGGVFSAGLNPVFNLGVFGQARGDNSGGLSSNVGVLGVANFANSVWNVGVLGRASSSSGENWAGYFEGDTKVIGTLDNEGTIRIRGTAPDGFDNVRASIDLLDDGERTELNLYGPIYNDTENPSFPNRFVNLIVNKGSSELYSGQMMLFAENSPNFQFGAMDWEDIDRGFFGLFGNEPDGEGWFHRHIEMSVVADEFDAQAGQISVKGSQGTDNIVLSAKHWETDNGINRGYISMKGNDPDTEFVNLGVAIDGSSEELGDFRLNDINGRSTYITPSSTSINGVVTMTSNANSNGELNLNSNTTGTGIRMYGLFDTDVTSHIALDDSGGDFVYLFGDGRVQASGNISGLSVTETSDVRLKTNILPLNNTLSKVLQLRGVSFNWKDGNKPQGNQIGVIAQEVEAIYPEFVHTDKEGMKSVNYSQMTAILIEAVKELNAKISSLEKEKTELKASLTSMDDLNNRLLKLETLLNRAGGSIPSEKQDQ